jgi:SM-20-related protein
MVTVLDLSTFDVHLRRGFFDFQTCCRLIDEMRRSPASPALTYGHGDSGSVNERIRRVSRVTLSTRTVAWIVGRLDEYRQEVAKHFGLNLISCEEPQSLCYREGDFFVAHQDGNTGLLRSDKEQSRLISVIIFLNRQTDKAEKGTYGGGLLVLSDWRNDRRLELAPDPGTLVAFRAETTHEVIPVTHGERYSIVSWYG